MPMAEAVNSIIRVVDILYRVSVITELDIMSPEFAELRN